MSEPHAGSRTLAVVGFRQLVTLRGPSRPRVRAEMRDLGIVEDGALLARDGRILAAGRYSELKGEIGGAAEIVDAGGGVGMPGFVDAHTHLVFAGNRADEFEKRIDGATYQEIAAAGGGIRSTVRRTRGLAKKSCLPQHAGGYTGS